MNKDTLYTIGYGKWATAKRIEKLQSTLVAAGVNTLVDIRHSPCASQLPPKGSKTYWPKPWHLQSSSSGIITELSKTSIDYRWIVELGNPQKNDRAMTILREHIESGDEIWPVNRGLKLLQKLLTDESRICCLMCVCPSYDVCHRKLIAETIVNKFPGGPTHIEDLSR